METIETFDFQSTVVDAVATVFDTMLAMEAEHLESVSQSYLYGRRILGSINLVGRVFGMVNIQAGDDFSRTMTATMLDLAPDEIPEPEAVYDVMGEVCNMIAGAIKSALCDAGLDCELSTPALTSGKDYRLETSPMDRHEYYTFYCGEQMMLVDVGVRMPDGDAGEDPVAESAPGGASEDLVAAFDVDGSIRSAVAEVFDTMLDMEIVSADAAPESQSGQSRILGSVSLSGRVRGRVNIEVLEPFSRNMAAAMLDMEPDDFESMDEITDVIGEVCNMISGSLKSDLCDAGLTCRLSPPSFTTGTDFTMENLYLSRQERFDFHCAGAPVVVAVGLNAAGNDA